MAVSELFFCILLEIVGRYFSRNRLTTTPTHTTISASGQSIINQHLLASNSKNIEKLFESWLQNILPPICTDPITLPARDALQHLPRVPYIPRVLFDKLSYYLPFPGNISCRLAVVKLWDILCTTVYGYGIINKLYMRVGWDANCVVKTTSYVVVVFSYI